MTNWRANRNTPCRHCRFRRSRRGQLQFEVTGAGTFEAVCNGDATSLESFKQPTMKLFNGQLVVIVRAAKQPGKATLRVKDKKLGISKTIEIKVG